jgi:hypothetical protein
MQSGEGIAVVVVMNITPRRSKPYPAPAPEQNRHFAAARLAAFAFRAQATLGREKAVHARFTDLLLFLRRAGGGAFVARYACSENSANNGKYVKY